MENTTESRETFAASNPTPQGQDGSSLNAAFDVDAFVHASGDGFGNTAPLRSDTGAIDMDAISQVAHVTQGAGKLTRKEKKHAKREMKRRKKEAKKAEKEAKKTYSSIKSQLKDRDKELSDKMADARKKRDSAKDVVNYIGYNKMYQDGMLYTQKHLFQALTPKSDYNPHRHGFSIEQVKRFPELLASPVVLANSPTREDVLLAILLATDAYDTPLIAGIKPDGTGNYGEREVETNMVLSVYSRQNFIRYFALLRDMDAFVFVSGRKIEALEDLSGLPLAKNCSGLDIDRILQRPKCLG